MVAVVVIMDARAVIEALADPQSLYVFGELRVRDAERVVEAAT